MVSYLVVLFLLCALALIFYTPVVIYGRVKNAPRWQAGRNYLAGMAALLIVTGGGLYKSLLNTRLAQVAHTADTRAVAQLLELGASPNARYRGVSALQNAYDR